MQKMIYLSNNRDYSEQGNINENKYFRQINELLEQGWKVAHVTQATLGIDSEQKRNHKETFVAFVLLEKPDESE